MKPTIKGYKYDKLILVTEEDYITIKQLQKGIGVKGNPLGRVIKQLLREHFSPVKVDYINPKRQVMKVIGKPYKEDEA